MKIIYPIPKGKRPQHPQPKSRPLRRLKGGSDTNGDDRQRDPRSLGFRAGGAGPAIKLNLPFKR